MKEMFIDALKGIGIVLMILGHMHFSDEIFNKYIFAFHMPLFFILSGYLYRKPFLVRDSIIKKAKALLVPYLFFGTVYYGIWIVCDYGGEGDIWKPMISLFVRWTEGLPIESALWFLPVLFLTFMFYVVIEEYIPSLKYRVWVIVVLTVVGCLITQVLFDVVLGGIGVALSALGFFLIGNMVWENKERLGKYYERINNLHIFVFVVVVNTILIFINGKLNMRTGEWAVIPLTYFNAVVGTVVYCKVAIWVEKCTLLHSALQYIGKNSIVYLCTNHLVIRISKKILNLFWDRVGIDSIVLYWILVFIISMLGMCFAVEVMTRTPLCIFINKRLESNR